MSNKLIETLVPVFTVLAIMGGGVTVYTNSAYFPKSDGVRLEQRVNGLETELASKLDLIIKNTEKK